MEISAQPTADTLPHTELAPEAQGLVRVDLHNHTYYSPDSILSPRRFLERARRRGLDCVAVTDHNTTRGALVVREMAGDSIRVIVGEEVRSRDGEVLGLFLSEEVPRGLSGEETIERIKAQGGIVGVPHPFDSLRSALRPRLLEEYADRLDFLEGLNARMVFSSHNGKAVKAAQEHGLPMSAGSDAHSPLEVGRAWVEMPDFSGPDDFVASLRAGRLVGKLSSPFVHMLSRYAVIRRKLGWRPPEP